MTGILTDEITKDPMGFGYAQMKDAQAADVINAPKTPKVMPYPLAKIALAVFYAQKDLNGLGQIALLAPYGVADVQPDDPAVASVIDGIGIGDAIRAAATVLQSRATVIGLLSPPSETDIRDARKG